LHNYGIRGNIYNWFRSYLCNRRQYICIGPNCSEIAYINCGVPQGSVLGPLLFLRYVNDIYRAVPGENIKLFADDTNLFIFDGDSDKLTQRANNCLKDLDNWFKSNKLTLNLDKTSHMVFSPRRIFSIKLLLNDVEIEKGHACKYLGIYIDGQLNWKHHIDYICEKLVKFTGIFYRCMYFTLCFAMRIK